MNHTGVGPSHSRGLQRLKTLVIIGMLVPLCALAQPPGHGIALFVRNFSIFDGNTPAYKTCSSGTPCGRRAYAPPDPSRI